MYLPELFTALLCGAVIGIDRELKGKPAGIRTCALVAMGSALFSILSYHFSNGSTLAHAADPTRIAAQIVSGVGFLGAGTILVDKKKVVGLTTSAIIWVVAAIGMAAGFRQLELAVSTTAITLTFIYLVGFAEKKFLKGAHHG